jgi:transposase-like protein
MANPIALAAALARQVTITCPHCGQKKSVDRRPREFRVCPRCHKHFTDPLGEPLARSKRR